MAFGIGTPPPPFGEKFPKIPFFWIVSLEIHWNKHPLAFFTQSFAKLDYYNYIIFIFIVNQGSLSSLCPPLYKFHSSRAPHVSQSMPKSMDFLILPSLPDSWWSVQPIWSFHLYLIIWLQNCHAENVHQACTDCGAWARFRRGSTKCRRERSWIVAVQCENERDQ